MNKAGGEVLDHFPDFVVAVPLEVHRLSIFVLRVMHEQK